MIEPLAKSAKHVESTQFGEAVPNWTEKLRESTKRVIWKPTSMNSEQSIAGTRVMKHMQNISQLSEIAGEQTSHDETFTKSEPF